MATVIDREKLKEQLQMLAKQDLTAFKSLVTEVAEAAKQDLANAKSVAHSPEEELERSEIDAIIRQDFERFDDVFRALA